MKRVLISICVGLMFFVGTISTVSATTISTGLGGGVGEFGEGDVSVRETWGQTFQLNAGDDTSLDSVTFYVDDLRGDIEFGFYLYAWDGSKITGGSLFDTGATTMTTTGQSDFESYTVNTGGVELAIGTDYIFFISASNYLEGTLGFGWVGHAGGDYYSGGGMAYINNGSDFGSLSESSWTTAAADLAFTLELSPSSVSSVPEPATILLLGSGLFGLAFFRRKEEV